RCGPALRRDGVRCATGRRFRLFATFRKRDHDMSANRLRFSIPLAPATGSIFQPTGFPDVGPATFTRPVGDGDRTVECLLVESPQSMANHLEGVGWDAAVQSPVAALEGLPWVRVRAKDDGRFLTSS